MAAGIKRKYFPSLFQGIRRHQITVINASVTVILISIVIFVLLSRASVLQRRTAEESVVHLAGQATFEVQTFYFSYLDMIRTLARVMQIYPTIDARERRSFVYNTMDGILASNRNMLSIYSLWKPNELDGMDALYANSEYSDESGQFIAGFTRELGYMERRTFPEFKYILDSENDHLDLEEGVFTEPQNRVTRLRDLWFVDAQVPILNSGVAVGLIGATINLDRLQTVVELLNPLDTGRAMVCTSDGTIVAHLDPQLRGVNFASPDEREPLTAGGLDGEVFQAILQSIQTQEYVTLSTSEYLIVSYPLRVADVRTGYNVNVTSGSSLWTVVTVVPRSTIFAPMNALLRFSVFFTIGAAILMVLVVLATSRSLTQRTKALQRDLEQASAMQDNLKFGLFLMDNKYMVQSAYSKALERILSVTNLGGKNFVNLMGSSVKAHEKDGLTDYFEMFFNESFDSEMLSSINPIAELDYVSTETNERKNLRTNFTRAEQGRAEYILGTVEDVTAENELKKQLLEAENKRENEMRSLFQVIQLDPRVLGDFVADAEYEFERINGLLKSKKELHKELLVDLFQSVHSVKSNALILNLEKFSERLHNLEASVKVLQEKPENILPFDEFLGLFLEIDDAMKELDQLKETVSKIENFRSVSGSGKTQEQYVLVETLTRVCDKTQTAVNKKVRLVIEDIDVAVLNNGPRREIKEILTQLVRNAVYHGIETPEEREPLGKDPEGEIRLSIKYRDNQIYMKITDNGNGIDFDKIQKKVEDSKLLQNKAEVLDKNNLLKTIFMPGFSTIGDADLHAGRGIGLSLVKDRVKDLHGNITVSTAQGKGTTFTISIPMELHVAADYVS